jgi:DNA modification methylase
MKPYEILTGDCFRLVKTLPTASVHCIVTSPPYFGLRDYGTTPRVWGGRKHCHHKCGAPLTKRGGSQTQGHNSQRHGRHNVEAQRTARAQQGEFCRKCDAWRGSFGQEPTTDLYVAHLVTLFRRLRRVLRDDGTVWLNLGDSYCGGGGYAPEAPVNMQRQKLLRAGHSSDARGFSLGKKLAQRNIAGGVRPAGDLKVKDLCGIPWLVALALRADGWYLRADIIWAKPNPMPEAVTDRTTRAHEYIFMLSKRAHYFYDAEAIKEPSVMHPQHRYTKREDHPKGDAGRGAHRRPEGGTAYNGRNRRSVWTITTQPFKAAHFAVYPEELVAPCIQAGTSEHGCCPKCGTPWERVIERTAPSVYRQLADEGYGWEQQQRHAHARGCDLKGGGVPSGGQTRTRRGTSPHLGSAQVRQRGWRAGCKCGRTREPVPCTVLDPFNGAGTTGAVALKLRRRYVGIELNPKYVTLAERRLRHAARTPQAQLAKLFG